MTLPPTGLPRDEVLARLTELRSKDLAARGGRTFAYVYDPARPDIDDLGHEVYASYLDVNGLDPTVFPSLMAMENDVVDVARRHLGSTTAVAVRAADWARAFAALAAAGAPVMLAGRAIRVANADPAELAGVLEAAGIEASLEPVPATISERMLMLSRRAKAP